MENIDTMMGAEKRTIKLGDKEYTVAPMGPYLLAEVVAYIKEIRRKQIAANARDMGVTDLAEVYALTNKPLTDTELNEYMEQPEIARMLIWLSLRVNHPDLKLDQLALLITTENMAEIVNLITGESSAKKANAPRANQ